ncbi:mandelate racemase/muconate lactonizing enzyme family protein [Natrialbaceae archaeon AArc-T1-2]|uniref:mandelate racemase/muconate lactonizing enzyme family protein n=1 Tax=Natrialbaceae archaeon AArc-T1-2 TaxID=3053904 RepID=UPI00255AC9EA|nr:enolase C-terminal domain-like protein [Natrialbaceae archaeon AArc-T1-2]WIV65902.1 enolase C-terminal domain-like protein [Natrialbaceae archaeon AArc-T1-2]
MKTSYEASVHPDFSTMDALLVVISTPDGERGIGTVDPSPGYSRQTPEEILSGLQELVPRVIDESPDHPNELVDLFETVPGNENVKCGIEMAYLDLYGRQYGLSIGELLGGKRRDCEPLNGWVGIDEPAEMVSDAKGYRDDGFDSIKIKLSGDGSDDIERIKHVCDAVGDEMEVRADVNGAYDRETAIEVAQAVEEYPLAHLEQPVPLEDLEGLADVTASSSTTVMADECLLTVEDVFHVLSNDIAGRLKLKALRLGGVLPTKRALDVASSANVPCVIGHGFGLSPSTSAELQLTASHDNIVRPIESVGPLKMTDEPFEPTITVEDGRAHIPEGDGLGITLNDSSLDSFAVHSEHVS